MQIANGKMQIGLSHKTRKVCFYNEINISFYLISYESLNYANKEFLRLKLAFYILHFEFSFIESPPKSLKIENATKTPRHQNAQN